MTDKEINNLKATVIYSSLGLGTATGLFFLARHFVIKSRKNIAEKTSLDEGDPSAFAKQLKMAFDNDNYMGWGTNEEMVFRVFEEIPSKAIYSKVQKAFFNLYGKNLNSELEDELSSEEFNKVMRILNAKR
jgi:hypothetical protein